MEFIQITELISLVKKELLSLGYSKGTVTSLTVIWNHLKK